MATAADSSSPYSPRFRRGNRNLSSPWSHVVRGEHEPILPPAAPPSPTAGPSPTLPEPSDQTPTITVGSGDLADMAPVDAAVPAPPPLNEGVEQGGCSGDAPGVSREKKSAWSKPANGVVEAGAVMWAVSWPALSEASKVTPKASSYDSLKGISNGSVPAPPAQVTTSPPPKSASSDANSSSSASDLAPLRHKSMKLGVGSSVDSANAPNIGGALANGRPVLPKMQTTPVEVSQGSSDKSVKSESSSRELSSRNGGKWDHGSRLDGSSFQSHLGNDHQKNYGGGRRGSHPGGGRGQHHNNFGNRPGLERGGYDWKHRSFGGGRDSQVQQHPQQQPRATTRPFIRPPPPVSAPFVAPPPPPPPPPVRPFANPMGFHDISSPFFYVPPPPPESLRGMPFVGPHAMFFAPADMQLRATLLKQIDYYFSPENLCKDVYLRQNMDEEGWVSIFLIAGFNRVRNLTNNIQFILETVGTSIVVEVQGDKVRRRNDWKNWPPLTPSSNSPNSSTKLNPDVLAARLTSIRMEEGSTYRPDEHQGCSH